MFRRLRVLAAFFMVPIVILASPNTAAAAGEWQTIDIGFMDSFVPDGTPGVDCHFSLAHAGGQSINVGAGYCTGTPDVTWGYTQAGESGSVFSIDVTGISPSGVCTGGMDSSLADHPANGTVRVAGTITSGSFGVTEQDCSITEVCMTVPLLFGGESCISVDIPAPGSTPDVELTSCAHGTPSFGWEWVKTKEWPQFPGYYDFDLVANFEVSGAPVVSTAQWFVAVQGNWGRSGQMMLNGTRTVFKTVELATSPGPAPASSQVYASPDPWYFGQPYDDSAQGIGQTRPNGPQQAFAGWTQPEHCRFYFGVPIANDGDATDEDIPFGDGITPTGPVDPEDPDPGPEPVLPDPEPVADEPEESTDWLGPIWALFDWLKRFLSGLIDRISSMLEGLADDLLIPDDDFLDSRFSTVESNWQGTSPAKYAHAVSGFTVGSASGCGGLPLSLTLPGGVDVDQNIGAACSGSMASAAGIVRAALTAVFVVGGMIACVRALGSGLGWNPGIGRGGAS